MLLLFFFPIFWLCQWLATGRRFSPGPPVSSTNKINRHDITEILWVECAVKHYNSLLTTGVSDEGYSRNQSCTLNYISAFLLRLWRSEHMINESWYYFLGLIFSSFVLTISFSSFFYSKHSFTYQSQYNYQPIWLGSKLRCIILSFICCIRRTGFWLYLKKIVTYRYIDDVLSINNSRFGDFVSIPLSLK